MGVKDLWTILEPVKEKCSISSLSGKTLAVDLSGWVCQANTTKGLSTATPKPYLRQVFVRVYRLCREGVRLVVVLDGAATQLKWSVMDARAKVGGGACHYSNHRSTGQRTFLNRQIQECCELLDVLGVPYIQSEGEAESLCALLNKEGYVDGVITQDGDAFLYGATVVYKDLSTDAKDPTVNCYTATAVDGLLNLTRSDLVSLALLIGCDYCPQGVPGVGKVAALAFIAGCKPEDSLGVLKQWKEGKTEQEKQGAVEAKIMKLSRGVLGFPSEAIIGEYTLPKDKLPEKDFCFKPGGSMTWKIPCVRSIQQFCVQSLAFPVESTCKKARYLLTAWVLDGNGCGHNVVDREGVNCSIVPVCIVKPRRERKVECYEIQWTADSRLAGQLYSTPDKPCEVCFNTIEKADRVRRACPEVWAEFEQRKLEKDKQRAPRRARTKTKNGNHSQSTSTESSHQGQVKDLSPHLPFRDLSPTNTVSVSSRANCALQATAAVQSTLLPYDPTSTLQTHTAYDQPSNLQTHTAAHSPLYDKPSTLSDSDSDGEPPLTDRLKNGSRLVSSVGELLSDDDTVPLLTRIRKSSRDQDDDSHDLTLTPVKLNKAHEYGVLQSTGLSPKLKRVLLASAYPEIKKIAGNVTAEHQNETGSKAAPIVID